MTDDAQITEVLGRNRLTDELLRAGLEVARPVRDRGIDLMAYIDLGDRVRRFSARPVQMKASKGAAFSINKKYAKFPDLLIAFVWYVDDPSRARTFVLSFDEALRVARTMGYTKTPSWRRGNYVTTRPGKRLTQMLEQYRSSSERWQRLVLDNRDEGLTHS